MFVSAWPVLNWIGALAWINYTLLTDPHHADHYNTYEQHRSRNQVSWLWYPPLWVYKCMWWANNVMIAIGAIIFTFHLDHTTSYYVSIMTLAFANIYSQKFFPIFYFDFHNWKACAFWLSLFMTLTAGAVSGLTGFKANQENQDIVYASCALWGVYFFWSGYTTVMIFCTTFPEWCPKKGMFLPVPAGPVPQGSLSAHAQMNFGKNHSQMSMYAQANQGHHQSAPHVMPQYNPMYRTMSSQAPGMEFNKHF